MATAIDNFRAWYVEPLRSLFPNTKAGFPILMIVFPLLERYLRQRVGLRGQDRLTDAFLDELVQLFGELKDRQIARTFWTAYRHGLLHEVTLSQSSRSGGALPVAWLSHDMPLFTVDAKGDYWLNPVPFATRIIETIEANFDVFEGGSHVIGRFPRVISVPTSFCTATGNSPEEFIVTGTNADPNDG